MISDKVKQFIYSSPDFRCTCFFNGWWLEACLAHDYDCADADAQCSKKLRKEADKKLWCNVSMSGTTKLQKLLSSIIGFIMYVGVVTFSTVVCRSKGYK